MGSVSGGGTVMNIYQSQGGGTSMAGFSDVGTAMMRRTANSQDSDVFIKGTPPDMEMMTASQHDSAEKMNNNNGQDNLDP